jgi:hypothetical protein
MHACIRVWNSLENDNNRYGELRAVTVGGQLVLMVTALVSGLVLAIPISVFGSNFTRENQIAEAEQIVAFDRETKRVLVRNELFLRRRRPPPPPDSPH